ncbi:MAG: BufA1 family periplasmic bufferin-type metallophore [Burkholderiales bacterium]
MKSTAKRALTATIASAFSLAVASLAHAQQHPEKPTYDYEKCYGVAKAGQNDCFTSNNSCAGTTTTDSDREAWVYMPKGTCNKIVGGSLDPDAE